MISLFGYLPLLVGVLIAFTVGGFLTDYFIW